MSSSSLSRFVGLAKNARYVRSNVTLRDVKFVATETNAASTATKISGSENVLGPHVHKCSNFDRWLLVWTKKFPNKDAVPDKVSVELLAKAQTQARIRTANIMIVLTILGCIGAVISGKQDAKAGITAAGKNEEWHRRINAEYKASLAAPKTT